MAQSIVGIVGKAVGLRVAAPFVLVSGTPPIAMAASSGTTGAAHMESSSSAERAGLCSPYNVLEIPHDASVEQAGKMAQRAVLHAGRMDIEHEAGSEFIVNMKLAAFAAIASSEYGEDEAWELLQQVRSRRHPLTVFADRRGSPGPPPHPPPASSQAGKSSGKGKPSPTPPAPSQAPPWTETTSNTSGEAHGSDSAIVPHQPQVTSQEPETGYGWQVRKGRPGKRWWGWVDDKVNFRLEMAFQRGHREVTAEIDGWTYCYDLIAMTQTSPNAAATEREIRRVICIDDSD